MYNSEVRSNILVSRIAYTLEEAMKQYLVTTRSDLHHPAQAQDGVVPHMCDGDNVISHSIGLIYIFT